MGADIVDENLIGKDEVLKVAKLARLSFSDQEAGQMSVELSMVLKHFETMQSINTDALAPMAHSMEITNVLREDEVTPSADREEVLSSAPAVAENRFLVPRILKEEL